MSEVSIFGCVLNETTESMRTNGYRMTTLETTAAIPAIMSWVTAGGTICSIYQGMLTIKGSLPSGIQSFLDAGGQLPSGPYPEVSIFGPHSLPTEEYEKFVWRMADLPRHPVPGDENYEEKHAAHHAAKEDAYNRWEAARDAVHGPREADS